VSPGGSLQHRVHEGTPRALASSIRVDDELGRRVRPGGRVELGVPCELLPGIPEQVADPAARGGEGQQRLLRQRADSIGGDGTYLQVVDLRGFGGRQGVGEADGR
jgi:hypothetical protein